MSDYFDDQQKIDGSFFDSTQQKVDGSFFDATQNPVSAVKPKSDQGHYSRGFGNTFKQLPQFGYGLLAGAGSGLESVFGEGGLSTGIKKAGVKGYQEWSDKIGATSKASDEFTYSYEKAKQGDFGAMIDWLQYGLGYASGQGVQALVGAGLGKMVGQAVLKSTVEKVAANLVTKEAAKIAATTEGKMLSEDAIKRLAVSKVAGMVGETGAIAGQSFGMEGGEIFGDLASKSVNENRALTGEELARAAVSTLFAGGLEFVGDKVGLDLLLGKSSLLKPAQSMPGIKGRLARGAIAGAGAAPIEGATEYAQTLIEEAGKGNDPFSDDALKQATNAAALGAVGGAGMGGVGGIINRPVSKSNKASEETEADPLFIENKPDPYISFPDGSVGKQSEIDQYISSLPEDQRNGARAALLGYKPETIAQEESVFNPQLLENRPDPYIAFPDGTVGKRDEVEAYINSLPEDQKIAARASLLGYKAQINEEYQSPENVIDSVTAAPTVDDAIARANEIVGAAGANWQKNFSFDANDLISQVGDQETVIQNRNRNTAASVVQMNEIASNPDYGRLSISRDFGNGAPVVFAPLNQPSNVAYGKESYAVAADGRRIPFKYAVVEASDILPSNKIDGSVNPEYATGVDGKFTAVNNGRSEALREAYRRDTANDYKANLIADPDHGISPDVIAGFSQPVLVREMSRDLVTPDIGDLSNTRTNADLNPLEQAKNDSRRINIAGLSFDDNGLTQDSVRQFVNSIPEAEATGLRNPDGSPTRQAVDRVMAAVFQTAYQNPDLVGLYAQATDPDAKNVLSAMAMAAPKVIQTRGNGDFDVGPLLSDAAQIAVNAKRNGVKLSDYIKNLDFTQDPETLPFVEFIAENIRSPKKISEGFIALADAMTAAHNANSQESMFEALDSITRGQVLDQFRNNYVNQQNEGSVENSGGAVSNQVATQQATIDAGSAGGTVGSQAGPIESASQEGFSLESETPDQVRARVVAQERASAAEGAAQQRFDAEQRQERIGREVAARQNISAENFQLGQSADDSLAGQGDIFSQDHNGELLKSLAADGPQGFRNKSDANIFRAKNKINGIPVQTPLGWQFDPSRSLTERDRVSTREAVNQLNAALSRSGEKVNPVFEAPTKEHALARELGRVFGMNVHFVSANNSFDGVAYRGSVYLASEMDVQSSSPELAIAGHEMLHVLEQKNPELGMKMRNAISQYLKDGVIDARQLRESKLAGKEVSREVAEGEVLADINGAMWLDANFWRELRDADRNLFRQAAYLMMEVLTKAIKVFSGTRFDAARFVSDVEAVRKILVDVWTEHNQLGDLEGVDSESNELAFSFAGTSSSTADKESLDKAKKMIEAGRGAEKVRQETGWYRGEDGYWRYEISDDNAALINPPINESFENFFAKREKYRYGETLPSEMSQKEYAEYLEFKESVENEYNHANRPRWLDDILHHPKLFAAYPDLKNVRVRPVRDSAYNGAYYPKTDMIELTIRDNEEMRSTLMHEVQHAIQHREGFATGGNADYEFAQSVKSALTNLKDRSRAEVDRWIQLNQHKIDAAKKASEIARYGLMYDSAKKLMSYANRDKPSGVMRLIRNEMQWIYAPEFDKNEDARALQRAFYNIPKPHKMRERNQFLSDMAYRAAQTLFEHIPSDIKSAFDNDPRTLRGMLNALQRESGKKQRDLAPMQKLKKESAKVDSLYETHQFSTPYSIYRALSGEIESRNVQARLNMTEEQRANKSPLSTRDVRPENSIILFGGLEIGAPMYSLAKREARDNAESAQKKYEDLDELVHSGKASDSDLDSFFDVSLKMSEAKENLAKELANTPDDMFAFSANTSWGQVFLNRSAKGDEGYQVTYFNKAGEPVSDTFHKSKNAALKQFVQDSEVSTIREFDPESHLNFSRKDVIEVDGVDRPTTNSSGRPLATTEEGIKNFWRWFGESKVVDADGRPLVVYHGTTYREITEFLPEGGNKESGKKVLDLFRKAKENNSSFGYMMFRSGSFFSSMPDYAGNYTGENTGVMYPAYIKAENPIFKEMSKSGAVKGTNPHKTPDALILTGENGIFNEIAVIDPKQIKSATGNNGEFSADNPDIRFSRKFDSVESYDDEYPDAQSLVNGLKNGELLVHARVPDGTDFKYGIDPSAGEFLRSTEAWKDAEEEYGEGPELIFFSDNLGWAKSSILKDVRNGDRLELIFVRKAKDIQKSLGNGKVMLSDGTVKNYEHSPIADYESDLFRSEPAGVESGDWYTNKSQDVVAVAESHAIVDNPNLQYSRKEQVESLEFKKWFGDSKVVDEEGNPKVMYRGSQHENAEGYGKDSMIFVTEKKSFAENYSGRGKLFEIFVKSEKPFDASRGDGAKLFDKFLSETGQNYYAASSNRGRLPFWTAEHDLKAWLNKNNIDYDGIYFAENDHSSSLAVKSINQIKSATENNGKFDLSNPDIRFSKKENLENDAEEITIEAPQLPIATGEEIERAASLFLSTFPEGTTRHLPDSPTARKAKQYSEEALHDIGGDPEAEREVASKMGPFSGYQTQATIEKNFYGDDQLVIDVFGKEQVENMLDEEPALKIEVQRDGEFSIYAPPSNSDTYKEFVKRGWAEPAKGKDQQIQYFTDENGGYWTRLTGFKTSELIPLLGDIHARARAWTEQPYFGLHWQRSTGASGGIDGHRAAILFSRKDAESNPRDLIITHNLTADNLIHADKMGGIPVPSLAVTKKSTPLSNFGDITLIGNKELADPRGYAKTKVFGADIYSPRYPTVEYDIPRRAQSLAEKRVADSEKLTGSTIDWREVSNYGVRYLEDSPVIIAEYLKSKGIEPNIVYEKPVSQERIQELEDQGFGKYLSVKNKYALETDSDFIKKAVDAKLSYYESMVKEHPAFQEFADNLKNEKYRQLNVARDLADEITEIARKNGEPIKADVRDTRDSLRKQVEGDKDYKAFARNFMNEIGAKEQIFKGYNRNGDRTYQAHTLENVVKTLKSDLRGGEGFNYGAGSLRAKFTPEFKSIADIRANKDRLVNKESFSKLKDEIDSDLSEIGNALGIRLDRTIDFLEEAGKEGIPKMLAAYGLKADQATQQKIAEFLIRLKNLPTEYFEAKILRGVGVHEFTGAVVPKDLSESARKILEKSGLKIREYDSDEDRAKVVESFADELHDSIGGVLFSRKETIVGDNKRERTPEQLRAFKNVGRTVEVPTLKERWNALTSDLSKKMVQGIVDQFAPVKEISEKAYMLMRLSKGASGAFEAMLKGGQLKLSDGAYDFDDKKRGGVIDRLLVPLQGEADDFMWWVAGNRAERLAMKGKERLFSAEDIAAFKTLADGETAFDYVIQHGSKAGQTTRNRKEIYRDSLVTFNEFNKNTLDMAEQSGLIDGESRKLWEDQFYVPFYRVSDEMDGGIRGMNIKAGVVRQKAFEKLKGGTDKLNSDLLENTLMNWAHLLDAAAKNRAAKATLDAAASMGVAIEAPESTAREMGKSIGNKNGVVWAMDGGKQRFYLVDDPYLLAALNGLEFAGMRGPLMDAMSAMKHAMTMGVTASPFFKVRNLIRDSVSAIGLSDLSYNPIKNIKDGYVKTDPKSDDYFRLLAGGGTIHFGSMLEGSESKRVRKLVESGVDESTILRDEGAVKAFYRTKIAPMVDAYNEIGNRGEAINRAALYDQLRKQGKSHAEASLMARDLMDFSMQGAWTSVRFLTQVVPFMNARLQGLYKLGKSAKEDPRRFANVLGGVALASITLMMVYGDDDDWKKREDWDRDNFWWFKVGGVAYRIPKPFEIGAIGTLAERGVEYFASDEMTGKRFMDRFSSLLLDNLSMNPIPQMVKPILDVYANKDSFTGRPIETMSMERLQSDYRFNGTTSIAARAMSTAGNSVTNNHFLSPVQIDHLIRGYFGWIGSFVVGASDKLTRPLMSEPTAASPDYWKVATGGMIADTKSAPSRYVTQMYDQAKVLEEAYGTWRMLQKTGKMEEAREFAQDNMDSLRKYKSVEAVKRAESKLNEKIRVIERSNLDADEKRARIQEVQDQKDRIARMVSL